MSTFSITYGTEKVQFGTMTGLSQSFNKKVQSTPIVSKSVLNTYQVESGSTMTLSISFSRKTPADADDSSKDMNDWSNVAWGYAVDRLMDRWQARTNGCKLEVADNEGDGDISSGGLYVPNMTVNGFIRSLSRKYSTAHNDLVTGTIEFTVGTMYVKNDSNNRYDEALQPLIQSVESEDYQIMMSDANRENWYALVYNPPGSLSTLLPSIRCVNSYELVGGIEQPFEYVTVELSKKALKTVAPELVGDDKGSGILAGRNKIRISAVGICNNMTVTKCKMTKDTFTITAYCDAEVLTGYKVSDPLTGRPLNIIKDILTSGTYGVYFEEGTSFIHNVSDKPYNMAIDGDTNAWTALQMCAMVLGAKMFFSGDKAYLINCISGNSYIQDITSIELDTKDKTNFMYGRVVEDISLGDEGTSTITNCVKVLCSGQNRGSYSFEDKDSIKAYNRHEHADITICDADDSDDDAKMCEDFARTYVDYRKCPQQSIEFTVDELSEDNDGLPKWTQFFPPITRVGRIIDSKDDVTISAVTLNGVPQKQTLMMTGYTRHYPKGTTRYEFGVISNVDLAESTSQIIAAQGTK